MCPICPKCKEIIKDLIRKVSGVESSIFYIEDTKPTATTEDEQFESDGNVEMYLCPRCDDELFNDWEEAEAFLKDEDKLKEIVQEKINKGKRKK